MYICKKYIYFFVNLFDVVHDIRISFREGYTSRKPFGEPAEAGAYSDADYTLKPCDKQRSV